MMSKTETPKPRLAGAVLCGVAALLLLLCSLHLFAGGAGGRGPGMLLLLFGAGLALAAVKSVRKDVGLQRCLTKGSRSWSTSTPHSQTLAAAGATM